MIVGNDISNYQGEVDWGTYKDNTNFVIIKASEGIRYIDTWLGNNRQKARDLNLPRGYYHFARPDYGNSAIDEARYFVDLMDGQPLQEGEVLALDYEVHYADPVTWCKTWLDFVSQRYGGMKPLLYLNQSLATSYDWSPVVDAGYGLWLASYTFDPNINTGETGKWPFMALQQWSDKQLVPGIEGDTDGDVFFGTAEQFKAYGYHNPALTANPQPVSNPSTPIESVPTPINTPVTPVPQPVTSPSLPPVTKKTHLQLFLSFLKWLIGKK